MTVFTAYTFTSKEFEGVIMNDKPLFITNENGSLKTVSSKDQLLALVQEHVNTTTKPECDENGKPFFPTAKWDKDSIRIDCYWYYYSYNILEIEVPI